jgi:hypothetical protein
MNRSILKLLLIVGIAFSSCTGGEKKPVTTDPVKQDTLPVRITIDSTNVIPIWDSLHVESDELFLPMMEGKGNGKPKGPKTPPIVQPEEPPVVVNPLPPPPVYIPPVWPAEPYKSRNVVYVNFDGGIMTSPYWNGGISLACAAATLPQEARDSIMRYVQVAFMDVDIQFTQDVNVYNAAAPGYRQQTYVTPTSSWKPGASGWTYTTCFWWNEDVPNFVFSDKLSNSIKMIAEIIIHENGHAIGLSHHAGFNSDCVYVAAYKNGPYMGNSLNSQPRGYWEDSPSSVCTVIQYDLTVLQTKCGVRR